MRQIVLLRGIHIARETGSRCPSYRNALGDAGYADVRTYVQSGNVVLSSDASPEILIGVVRRPLPEKNFDGTGVAPADNEGWSVHGAERSQPGGNRSQMLQRRR